MVGKNSSLAACNACREQICNAKKTQIQSSCKNVGTVRLRKILDVQLKQEVMNNLKENDHNKPTSFKMKTVRPSIM